MDVNQLIEGIGAATAAAKPAQEYCLLFIDWWPMCMTKSEWAAWLQFLGVGAALFSVVYGPAIQRAQNSAHAKKMLLSAIVSLRQNANYAADHFQKPSGQAPVKVVISLFEASAAPLAAFPFNELGDAEISLEAMTLSSFAKAAVKAFDIEIPIGNRHLLFVDMRNQCDQALKRFWPDHKI